MVTYDFYTDTYRGGSISAADWPIFEARAAEQLSLYKRRYTVTIPGHTPDAEGLAICAMADVLAYFTAVQNGLSLIHI